MNKNIIPKTGSMDAKLKIDDEESWLKFARKITKNPFVLNYLLERDEYNCQWCFQKASQKNVIIHHKDYEHVCAYNKTRKYSRPTEKRPNKKVTVPDCESCKKENEKMFESCVDRLAIVHRVCNYIIEKKRA